MATFFRNDLDVIRPDLGEKVGALFTERVGGVSSGPWGGPDEIMGLNVGTRVGDNAGCVRMNRNMVAQMTEGEPRWMTQVHGTTVVDAELVETDAIEADAATAVTPGVVCVVQVADCLPVLLAEKDGRAVAAVHAGWRSLAAGIVEKTVARLKERLGDETAPISAWLGPRIGDDDFETNEETAAAFAAHFGGRRKAFRQRRQSAPEPCGVREGGARPLWRDGRGGLRPFHRGGPRAFLQLSPRRREDGTPRGPRLDQEARTPSLRREQHDPEPQNSERGLREPRLPQESR